MTLHGAPCLWIYMHTKIFTSCLQTSITAKSPLQHCLVCLYRTSAHRNVRCMVRTSSPGELTFAPITSNSPFLTPLLRKADTTGTRDVNNTASYDGTSELVLRIWLKHQYQTNIWVPGVNMKTPHIGLNFLEVISYPSYIDLSRIQQPQSSLGARICIFISS